MAPLPPRRSSQQMPVDMGSVFLLTDGFAMYTITRMCANRRASRRQNTRNHPPMIQAGNDLRAASISGDSCSSQINGSAAWAKLLCLSLEWQQRTTRATSLDDARFAGKTVSDAPRMIYVKSACDAMWTTNTRAGLSQTPLTCRRAGQWRYRAH